MSRIGKKVITLPANVTLAVSPSNEVTVKGPKGELKQQLDRDLKVEIEGTEVTISRPTDQIRHRALHGLSRSLVNNMVVGVTDGYELKLELVGVGYRAAVNGQQLDLSLGYSHNIIIEMPKEVTATAVMEKGKPPLVTLTSIDKQLVGQVAAKVRSMRKPEPYKGKGVRFQGEVIRRKAGKTAGK
ncbi:MAG: 50S ribosomal protein L6 [Sphingobacteriales bacterium]|nr:MAG: 50S ribosomal protein L6 [Sphingobacteriales bacterium]